MVDNAETTNMTENMMLVVPAPALVDGHLPLRGLLLEQQFAAAGLEVTVTLDLVNHEIILGGVDETNKKLARALVTAHPATVLAFDQAVEDPSDTRTAEVVAADLALDG